MSAAADGVRILEIEGEFTIHTASDRKIALTAMLDGARELHLDLSGVTELDTAGLQLLLMARREAAAAGHRLVLSAVSQIVVDVLAIAHLAPDLTPAPTPDLGAALVPGRPQEVSAR